jgi:hypothetical protein
MIKYQLLPFESIAEIVARNCDSHAMEASTEVERPLRMDWQAYLKASKDGSCVAVLATDGDKVAGYSFYSVGADPHAKNYTDATNCAFFVFPEYRKGLFSVKFLKKCDEMLREKGVSTVNYILKSKSLGRLLQMAGYQPSHTVWSQ